MDQRRVRFDSIEGLQRSDIDLAAEVWLRDICAARWATPQAMKIAAQLVRYMSLPDTRRLTLSSLEHQLVLNKEEIAAGLKVLRLYRAVEDFVIEVEGIKAALHLSTLQRLQVLEARDRLAAFSLPNACKPAVSAQRWLLSSAPDTNGPNAAATRTGADLSTVGY